jgi:uncharacterized membrane protein HdeD (DUF308 family)
MAFLRASIRLSFAVLGSLLAVAGLAALIAGLGSRVQTLVLHGALYLLIGSCVAYWAFTRAPWESERNDRSR